MIHYNFFESYKLLIIQYEGEITEEELTQFIPFIFQDCRFFTLERAINDFRKTIFKFDIQNLENLITLRESFAKQFPIYRLVHLIDTVHQTTYSVFYNQLMKERNVNIATYTSLEAAIRFLGLSMTEKEMEEKIRNLKYQFKPGNYE